MIRFNYAFIFGLISIGISAQVNIKLNLDVKHKLGEVESFDRKKFINIHASLTETDWDGDNEVPNYIDNFLTGYDVYLGRNTGGIQWQMNNQITEDPARPGFASPESVAGFGQTARNSYANTKSARFKYEFRNDWILCAQIHPFYPDGTKTKLGWSFSQADTQSEPLGTASGEYMGRYIKENFGTGGATGENRPAYCEVVNEPEWDLIDYTTTPIPFERICTFHKNAAKEIHKQVPGMLVGGYCTAFPDHEKDNFFAWTDRWKQFMDVAGDDIDFWTIHLYDFPAKGGKKQYRKGGNMEATFDMMEQYSMMKFGKVKPFMVSEFGASVHDYDSKAWSPYRDWLRMASVNSMWLQFMERANIINKVVPFTMNKAEWAYTGSVTSVHGSRLMRKKDEPASYTGQWVYTEQVKMYQLWSDVKGERVDVTSDNVDMMVDAYVDKNVAYLIVNNLDFVPRTLKLNVIGVNQTPTNIKIKHLYLQGGVGGIPVLDVKNVASIDSDLEIGAEATYVIAYTYPQNVVIDKLAEEKKYYADTYFQRILTSMPITFNINGVEKGTFGEAVLRIGVGRDLGKFLRPTVKVNGTTVVVPTNYRGDTQSQRASFFGMLEIPISNEILKENNQIVITFPDNGGYVSSVTLRSYVFSDDIRNRPATSMRKNGFNQKINIFPNPANNFVSVDPGNENHTPYDVNIFTLDGRKLMSWVNYTGLRSFDITELHQGYYTIQVSGDAIQNTLPLLKK